MGKYSDKEAELHRELSELSIFQVTRKVEIEKELCNFKDGTQGRDSKATVDARLQFCPS
jgi:hypothetical protein